MAQRLEPAAVERPAPLTEPTEPLKLTRLGPSLLSPIRLSLIRLSPISLGPSFLSPISLSPSRRSLRPPGLCRLSLRSLSHRLGSSDPPAA